MLKQSGQQSEPLLEFLTELATHLIASGVNLQAFQALAEGAFVRAASSKARLGNSRVNQSSLAAITGLSRGQIRAILRNSRPSTREPKDPITQLINGWITDPAFLGSTKKPRRLPLRGPSGSFSELSKRYGADVTPKALLRELLRLKKVRVVRDHVELADTDPRSGDYLELHNLSSSLAKALRPPSVGQDARIRSTYLEKHFCALSRKDAAILRRRANQTLRAFFDDLGSVIEAAGQSPQSKNKTSGRMAKLGVILVSQE